MMDEKLQLTVSVAIVRNEEGKFLLQRRVDPLITNANGKWEFPGGSVEFGESPEEAAMRELQEEAGCRARVEAILPHIFSNTWERTDGVHTHVLIIGVVARYQSGDLRPLDEKVSEVSWFGVDEVKKLDTLPGVAEFVEETARMFPL